MKAYQEITLRPSEEIPCHFLWEKLFQQVHLALVESKTTTEIMINGKEFSIDSSEYGLSFPQYDSQLNALGCKLRVFARTDEKLEQLKLLQWMERLLDYCNFSSIETVPDDTGYACFYRKQFLTNVERMARRRAKRKNEPFEQALTYYSGFNDELTRLPFVHVQSLSKNKRFPLFIGYELVNDGQQGDFNCYGLSKTATVPWF